MLGRIEGKVNVRWQFACKISETYLKCNVVDGGSCRVRPAIAGTLGAVEQGDHLGVAAVAVRNLEKRAV